MFISRNLLVAIFVAILLLIILIFAYRGGGGGAGTTGGTTYDGLATAQRSYRATGAIASTNVTTTVNATGTHWTVAYAPSVSSGASVLLTPPSGTGPFTWILVSGSLPPGMSIINGLPVVDANGNATGALYSIIAGQPQQSGTFTFTLQVTDTNGNSQTLSFTLTINAPPTMRVCADGSTPNSPCPATHTIQIGGGDNQEGVRGHELPQPFKVTVTPAEAGIGVAWKVINGTGKFRSWTTTTDAAGTAEAHFMVGAGQNNRIEASLFQGGSAASPKPRVTFNATGGPPKLVKVNDNQTIVLTSSTEKALILKVTDRQDRPMEGVKVAWKALPSSNGSRAAISPDEDRQVVGASFTDASGAASAIVGTGDMLAGTYTIVARLPKYGVSERFTVTFTPPGFLHANDNVMTLIPGQDLALKVCYDKAPANPPPLYETIPVVFALVSGDGTLDPNGNPAGTDGTTCIGEINYTFGKDAYPDIVSATGAGETVYFSMTPPNVEVTRIDFLDNYNIRQNNNIDIPDSEHEWIEEDPPTAGNHNHPVAYQINKAVRVKIRIRSDRVLAFAKIKADVLGSGTALQKVNESVLSFSHGTIIVEYILRVDGTTASTIAKDDVRWIWRVSDMNGLGSLTQNSVASGEHTVYTLINTPRSPMAEPWVEVLDHSTSGSWGGGNTTDATAAVGIEEKIYGAIGFAYDIAKAGQAFGPRANLNLTALLAHLDNGGSVECNCYDAAQTMVVFSNALGLNTDAVYMFSRTPRTYILSTTGATVPDQSPTKLRMLELLNIIDPIGRSAGPTNNIMPQGGPEPLIHDDTRSGGFQNHLFVRLNRLVYDPTLKVSRDSPRNGAPNEFAGTWTYVLPAGMPENVYYNRLFDNGPTLTNVYDADGDGIPEQSQRETAPLRIVSRLRVH